MITGDAHVQLVVVDQVAYLVPAIRPDMPARLRRLLQLRREATITGQCPRCSATATAGGPLAPHLASWPWRTRVGAGLRRRRRAAARALLVEAVSTHDRR